MLRRLFAFTVLALLFLRAPLTAQTPQEVRRAFANLKSDDIPNNCGEAVLWLYKRRDKLKAQMLDQLYNPQTDFQARDALLIVLFKTESFVPDQRFAKFVMARIPEEDSHVGNFDIEPDPEHTTDMRNDAGAHHAACRFIDAHFDLFEPLLADQISTTKDMWWLWADAWLMKKRGVLPSHAALFTPDVLARAAVHLRNDKVRYNASQAVRLFLLLGEQSLPVLRQSAKSTDAQQNNMSRALIDAIGEGNHKAFGYLNSKLNLSLTPFGDKAEDPAWLDAETEPYLERDKYP